MIVFLFVLALPLTILSVFVFVGMILDQARKVRARSAWYVTLAVISWLISLLATYGLILTYDDVVSKIKELDEQQFDSMMLLAGPVGSAIGPALAYIYCRMRTAQDPDYGPVEAKVEQPPGVSRIADIGQPRDGHHLRPE